jgi:hypothetical protein
MTAKDRSANRVGVRTPGIAGDARKIAAGVEVLRKWWILLILLAFLLGLAGGALIGIGGVSARFDALEARVGKLEKISSKVERIEGMLDWIYFDARGIRYPKKAEETP